MSKKLRIGTNRDRERREVAIYNAEADLLYRRNELIEIINKALSGNYKDLESIKAALKEKTGFPNCEMGAYAFNVKEEYLELVSLKEPTIDLDHAFKKDAKNQLIPIKERKRPHIFHYEIKEEFKKEFNELIGEYIEGENLDIYLRMVEFKRFYEELPPRFQQGRAVDFTGKGMIIRETVFQNGVKR